ncbi:zinc-binding oxidoreductase [Scheffersomyces xylosifermentans]|uniref:zinc-binding oxidoreductase n=1 Tax=Scheffersomyces xylosifermentans TaxID=1304137 RepID=UPI00315D26CF
MTVSTIKVALATGSKNDGEWSEVASIPLPQINDDQILIKSVAFAVNPTDWKHLFLGLSPKGVIIGSDVSGIVERVGANVTKFAKGDYVSGFIHGESSFTQGAFGEYSILNPGTAIKYDSSKFTSEKLSVGDHPSDKINTFEGAASVSLGLVTVALSFGHSLKIDTNKESHKGKSILIWGGATATGVLAIQVAKLVYGLEVIATASSKNHKFLQDLGADAVFDYKDPNVVSDIKSYAKGSIHYALDTVASATTYQATYDATEGADSVGIDNLLTLNGSVIETKKDRKVHFGQSLAYTALGESINLGMGVIESTPELQKDFAHFWEKVLPPYISEIKTSNLKVLTPGLASTNEALDLLKQDKVSGEKVVFRLE